jgi:hypothetical protein
METSKMSKKEVGYRVVTYPDGRVKRLLNGLLHDGPNGEPAVVHASGITERYRNGLRNDGPNGEPAIDWTDGGTERYRDGLRHDGVNGEPAIVWTDGTVEHWRKGVMISEASQEIQSRVSARPTHYDKRIQDANETIYRDKDLVLSRELIERAKALGYPDYKISDMEPYIGKRFSEIDRRCVLAWLDCAALIDGWIIDGRGNKFHHIHGKLHDGPNGEPAIVYSHGTTARYRNGKLHDGPNGEPCPFL